ncbi:MAG: hypothetical protein V2A73_16865, partial [Pseudomonadota bacterium]
MPSACLLPASTGSIAPFGRRAYDHRIREQVCQSGNPNLFRALAIPRSTTRSWLARPLPEVVSLEPSSTAEADLRASVAKLEAQVRVLQTVVRLLMTLIGTLGIRLDEHRLPLG